MKTIVSFFKAFLFIIILILAFAASFQYLYCPVYVFPKPTAFSGEKVFNPYAGMDSTCWKKANFHLHTHQWGGITNGGKTSAASADSVYHFLNYDIIGISDYQSINYYRKDQKGFIPIYEHGYMFPKNHQNIIGAHNVCWLDYPFPETLNNEQNIIEALKKDTGDVVAVAHPLMRNAYSPDDFRFLCGYDCIEVFDRIIYSEAYWDSALSAGHPAFATSVDDNHDINDISEVGSNFSLVNVKDVDEPSVLNALKTGKMIACDMYKQRQNDFIKKKAAFASLPVVNNVVFENNQLKINANTMMRYLHFIGQDGAIRETVNNVKAGVYDFKPGDTYIRTDICFEDSTIYHLNPVFRYSGNSPEKPVVLVDEKKTMIHHILFYISLFALIFALYLKIRR